LKNYSNYFLKRHSVLDKRFFYSAKNKFSFHIYEAVFVALTEGAYRDRALTIQDVTAEKLEELKNNSEFKKASSSRSNSEKNVKLRIQTAKELL
jgi:hypothetical protein